jgi:O-antigen/teichoic acid export membrane protein
LVSASGVDGSWQRLATALTDKDNRDALIVTAARLTQNALGFIISLVILKKFGLEGVGSYTVASFGVAVMATLLTFGLPFTLAKSTLDESRRNAVGALAGLLALLLSLPLGAALGLAFGHNAQEVVAIALLSLGGAYFANNSILDALLVLQGRTRRILIVAVGYLLGVGSASLMANTLVEFAIWLALGRLGGLLVGYLGLSYRWCKWQEMSRQLRLSAPYLLPDSLGLMAEQLPTAILAPLTSRGEIAIYGLCRQFLSAAETPLWSRLVVLYPRLCTRPRECVAVAHAMAWRGLGVMLALILVVAALAQWVYESSQMQWLGPLLMLAIPLRYLLGTAEIGLRAVGAVHATNYLGLIRLALVMLIPLGLHFARIPGVVVAVIVQAFIAAWLAERALRHATRREDA